MAWDIIGAAETLTTYVARRKPPFVCYQVRLNLALAELGIAPRSINRAFYTGLTIFGIHAGFKPRELAALVYFRLPLHPIAETKITLWERHGSIRPGLAIMAGDSVARIWEEAVRGTEINYETADDGSRGETNYGPEPVVFEPTAAEESEPVEVGSPASTTVDAAHVSRSPALEGHEASETIPNIKTEQANRCYDRSLPFVCFLFAIVFSLIISLNHISIDSTELLGPAANDSAVQAPPLDVGASEAAGGSAGCDDNTVEMISCLHKDFVAADTALNDAYQNLIAKLTNVASTGTSTEGGATESDVELLRRAQRAWIDFKVKECTRQRAFAGGGTAGPIYALDCEITLTVERTGHLRADLGSGE